MKSNMLSSAAVVVLVAALAGVTRAMPIEREPRQFVYQPGSPSVRLYPVHFENYLKSSSGRVHMTTGQGFMLNMLPSAVEKPERTANEAPVPVEGPTMQPSTTTPTTTSTTTSAVSTSTTSTTTTSEHKMDHMTTMKPMVVMMETTLRPEVEDEVVEGSLPEARTESPNPEILPETVTEEEMAAQEGEEVNEVTELAPTMMKEGMEEEMEMETATELNNETPETAMDDAVETPANTEVAAAAAATENEEAPATEMMPEEEMATETPPAIDLRRHV